jgi:hypothetical protein
MSITTNAFCEMLVDEVPEIKTIMNEHLRDNDELLPYVFLGDVTRCVLSNNTARMNIVDFLERHFHRLGPAIENLIAVSFVENIDTQHDLDIATRGVNAVNLVEEWRRQKTG